MNAEHVALIQRVRDDLRTSILQTAEYQSYHDIDKEGPNFWHEYARESWMQQRTSRGEWLIGDDEWSVNVAAYGVESMGESEYWLGPLYEVKDLSRYKRATFTYTLSSGTDEIEEEGRTIERAYEIVFKYDLEFNSLKIEEWVVGGEKP